MPGYPAQGDQRLPFPLLQASAALVAANAAQAPVRAGHGYAYELRFVVSLVLAESGKLAPGEILFRSVESCAQASNAPVPASA